MTCDVKLTSFHNQFGYALISYYVNREEGVAVSNLLSDLLVNVINFQLNRTTAVTIVNPYCQ